MGTRIVVTPRGRMRITSRLERGKCVNCKRPFLYRYAGIGRKRILCADCKALPIERV